MGTKHKNLKILGQDGIVSNTALHTYVLRVVKCLHVSSILQR